MFYCCAIVFCRTAEERLQVFHDQRICNPIVYEVGILATDDHFLVAKDR